MLVKGMEVYYKQFWDKPSIWLSERAIYYWFEQIKNKKDDYDIALYFGGYFPEPTDYDTRIDLNILCKSVVEMFTLKIFKQISHVFKFNIISDEIYNRTLEEAKQYGEYMQSIIEPISLSEIDGIIGEILIRQNLPDNVIFIGDEPMIKTFLFYDFVHVIHKDVLTCIIEPIEVKVSSLYDDPTYRYHLNISDSITIAKDRLLDIINKYFDTNYVKIELGRIYLINFKHIDKNIKMSYYKNNKYNIIYLFNGLATIGQLKYHLEHNKFDYKNVNYYLNIHQEQTNKLRKYPYI